MNGVSYSRQLVVVGYVQSVKWQSWFDSKSQHDHFFFYLISNGIDFKDCQNSAKAANELNGWNVVEKNTIAERKNRNSTDTNKFSL